MHKRQPIGRKNRYYRGQLLIEDDFIAEQQSHARARRRHSLNLHGIGIVRGFVVSASGPSAVSVSPGFAVDRRGHEIEASQQEVLELSSFPPGALVTIALTYEEEDAGKKKVTDAHIEPYAVLTASTDISDAALLLATVKLDERGHVIAESISTASAHRFRTPIAPGSVTVAALDTPLRTGWLR